MLEETRRRVQEDAPRKALTLPQLTGSAVATAFTVTYAGFVNSENQSVLGGTLTFGRAPGENVGSYLITPSGLTSANYAITFNTGMLTITAAPAPVILPLTGAGTANVVITWSAVSNVTYRVQYKSDLNSAWVDLAPDITATNSITSTTDPPGGATQRFYQVTIP